MWTDHDLDFHGCPGDRRRSLNWKMRCYSLHTQTVVQTTIDATATPPIAAIAKQHVLSKLFVDLYIVGSCLVVRKGLAIRKFIIGMPKQNRPAPEGEPEHIYV